MYVPYFVFFTLIDTLQLAKMLKDVMYLMQYGGRIAADHRAIREILIGLAEFGKTDLVEH